MDDCLACPLCDYQAQEGYSLMLHVETIHAEGRSPFSVDDEETSNAIDHVITQEKNSSGDLEYAECPIDGCGEVLPLLELDYHLELHAAAEDDDSDIVRYNGSTGLTIGASTSMNIGPPRSRPSEKDGSKKPAHCSPGKGTKQASTIQAWKQLFAGSSKAPSKASEPPGEPQDRKRLGKAELGKYAHERKMPDWLVSLLEKEVMVHADGIIPVIAQLLEQNSGTRFAYLCDPRVCHISKLKREGGFCGYRNIQMLISYMNGVRFTGSATFRGNIPSIFSLQDYIENAWDLGINAQGRVETGGVRGTRKYIGTPEAQAIFISLGIPCDAQGFKSIEPGASLSLLLDAIERYFQSGTRNLDTKVRRTALPPIYLQHPGHSLTIVGFEKSTNGERQLLVFDPIFRDSPGITRLVGRVFEHRNPGDALRPYMRGRHYLRKYKEFEVLRLTSKTDASSAR